MNTAHLYPPNCPRCTGQRLSAVIRDGVEIDVCHSCHGVWLDRFELDKLIGSGEEPGPAPLSAPIPADRYNPDRMADEGQPEVTTAVAAKKREKPRRRGKSWGHRLGEMIEDLVDELEDIIA